MKRLAAIVCLWIVAAVLLVVLWPGDARPVRRPGTTDAPAPSRGSAKLETAPGIVPASRSPRAISVAPPETPEPHAPAPLRTGPEEEPRRFWIEGRVLDENAAPVAGADLLVRDGGPLARTGVDGRFGSEGELSPAQISSFGTADFLVVADGYSGVHVRPSISGGTTVRLGDVVLGPGTELSGSVLDEDGAPVVHALVIALAPSVLPADPEDFRANGPNRTKSARRFDPLTLSDSDGRFHLRGAPAGPTLLCAWRDGWSWTRSEVFEALAAEPSGEHVLTLERRARNWLLGGRVTRPDGQPHPRAWVTASWPNASGRQGVESVEADDQGVFALDLQNDGPWTLEARDRDGRFYAGVSHELAGGRDHTDVVLALGEPRWLAVRLVDNAGAPVPWGHVRCRITGPLGLTRPLVPLGESGRESILRPRRAFRLEALAPGFRTQTFGPFEPEVEGPLSLTLIPGQAVRGRVTLDGRPVAGARIGIRTTALGERVLASAGVTPLARPFLTTGSVALGTGDATTGPDGRFLASLHRKGGHAIVVEATDLPTTVFGPFDWSLEEGASDLELELASAGAIEGRLLVAPGRDAAGRLVGASGRWNFVHSTSVAADGTFRIEGLAPGPYQVRALVPPVGSLQSYHVQQAEGAEVVWDCRVVADSTAHVDVDLRNEGCVVVRGRFTWDGQPPDSGNVNVWRVDDGERVAFAELDPQGAFRLELFRPGKVRLELRVGTGSFVEELDLPRGETEWVRDLSRSALRLRGDFTHRNHDEARVVHLEWQDDETGLRFLGSFRPFWKEPGEEGLVSPLPAGKLALSRGGETWTEVLLKPGAETAVDVP